MISSGDLYHLVETYSVITAWQTSPSENVLARPKSQSLTVESLFMSKFDGFKSRWISFLECKYFNAQRSCQTMKRLWTSIRMFALITECTSLSSISKTTYKSLLLVALWTANSSTIRGFPSICLRKDISRKVLWASVEFRNAPNIFFNATCWWVTLSTALKTMP